MTDQELLLAISNIVQSQVEPLKRDMRDTRLLLENDILPRLQNIESCYTSTYRRYAGGVEDLQTLQMDMGIVKKVAAEHSEKLQKISQTKDEHIQKIT